MYHFNGEGANVIAPIPVEGLRYKNAMPVEEQYKIEKLLYDLNLELGSDFSSWCMSTKRNQIQSNGSSTLVNSI